MTFYFIQHQMVMVWGYFGSNEKISCIVFLSCDLTNEFVVWAKVSDEKFVVGPKQAKMYFRCQISIYKICKMTGSNKLTTLNCFYLQVDNTLYQKGLVSSLHVLKWLHIDKKIEQKLPYEKCEIFKYNNSCFSIESLFI